MKPDAFLHVTKYGDQMLAFKHDDNTHWKDAQPLYSAATIRKAMEECTEEMWQVGMNTEGGTDDKYRAMIAAKLKELEGK